ncbi:universal stress protein [Streptomyces sp. NPDC001652]|uniref:universal stress protein n=1 Tax=Streptomyces sp. NPDC001652 TaxID=3154393 RepID=UPI0033275517
MVRIVVTGLDGSVESWAAAEWAAREAELRGLPLKLLHVGEPVPDLLAQAPLLGGETLQYRSETVPRDAAEGLRLRHPGLAIVEEQRRGGPAEILLEEEQDAELLVLGSRGLSGIGGFLVGSVGLAVVAHAERPVVLVRADERRTDDAVIPPDPARHRPVVLGLDVAGPDESLFEFAFDAAVRRSALLRVVYGWNLPPYYTYGLSADLNLHDEITRGQATALAAALAPWLEKYPAVEVIGEPRCGNAAGHLVDASREAELVVVGRRIRRSPLGAHIGPVTHAVLHHASAPVAVVAHA